MGTVHHGYVETESQKQIKDQERTNVIICICRGKSERHIASAIESGAETLSDLQLCGIGDQCGSCHNSLRGLLTRAVAPPPACPACLLEPVVASAHA
jgi:bacterioferritin-associated ferredoxin